MSFDQLLGNGALKSRLASEAKQGRLSHCYLLAGPEGSGKHTLARLVAAAAQCEGDAPPCGVCLPCRKVLAGVHPDVSVVDDAAHKQLPAELIRAARAGVFIRPNEGRRKILIFPRAQDMNATGQNALLKLLEEPPAYAMFLLLADAAEKLLPTIRSRCAELRLSPLPDGLLRAELARRFPDAPPDRIEAALSGCGGFLGRAAAILEAEPLPQTPLFAKAYGEGDTLGLLSLFCSMEKLNRDRLLPIIQEFRRLIVEALLSRQGAAASPGAMAAAARRTPQALLAAADALEEAAADCRANVNTATICAALFARLR